MRARARKFMRVAIYEKPFIERQDMRMQDSSRSISMIAIKHRSQGLDIDHPPPGRRIGVDVINRKCASGGPLFMVA